MAWRNNTCRKFKKKVYASECCAVEAKRVMRVISDSEEN